MAAKGYTPWVSCGLGHWFWLEARTFPEVKSRSLLYVPSLSGKAGKVFTWNGRKGLPSWRGNSSLSSELTRTSTGDSEMEDVNWSMSARCSCSSSSKRKNKGPGRREKMRRKSFQWVHGRGGKRQILQSKLVWDRGTSKADLGQSDLWKLGGVFMPKQGPILGCQRSWLDKQVKLQLADCFHKADKYTCIHKSPFYPHEVTKKETGVRRMPLLLWTFCILCVCVVFPRLASQQA